MNEIVISKSSYNSDDEYETIYSNIDYLNTLFAEYLTTDEVSQDAMRSYYVDYYLAQVNNGGFSQFVYNTGWNAETIEFVLTGLTAINAKENLALFKKSAAILDQFTPEQLEQFLDGEYWGENEERDTLSAFDDEFYDLQERECLTHLNHVWLKNHKHLVVANSNEWDAKIKAAADSIPNKAERVQAALDNEPRYLKLIRALCEHTQQTLERVTMGDPSNEYQGEPIIAWHFITDNGRHYMLDTDGSAIIFNGDSETEIARIPAGAEFG